MVISFLIGVIVGIIIILITIAVVALGDDNKKS